MPGMSLGIDLGTANVTIYVRGQGIMLREPSVIAVDKETEKMIACGRQAYTMLGRTPDSIYAVRPVKKGVISEYDYAEQMLRVFVRRVCAYKVLKPRAAASVPASVTEVEQRSLVEAVLASGVRRVSLIDEAIAAAVGAGIKIDQPYGSMVVNIGAGTTDIAVLSLKGVASSTSIRVGGDDMDESIVRYLHNKHNHIIGHLTAEQVKISVGSAVPPAEDKVVGVKGRNIITGLPCIQKISRYEIFEAMQEPISRILLAIQRVLETTPPELAGDIIESGICLTGGCAQLDGMDLAIKRFTGVDCWIVENPADCVAVGTGESPDYLGSLFSGAYDVGQFSFPVSDSAKL